MNSTEKLALIERVNHASGDQAKRALQSMILKCTITQSTIARAIKDAIERHTPTPLIVYEEPEPRGDGDAAPAPNNKKKHKSDRDQNDDFVLSAAPEEHDGSAHDEFGAVKIKAKKKGKRNGSGHLHSHDSPDSPKKKKIKKIEDASKFRTEVEQTLPKVAIGRSSKRFKPSVIDLVSSSDAETHGAEQPEDYILDKRVSDDDSDLVTSSEDEASSTGESKNQILHNKIPNDESSDTGNSDRSSTTDSSGDENSMDEQHDHALTGCVMASQEGSDVETAQADAKIGGGTRRAQSVTVSMAKASKQQNDNKMYSFGLDKKRKALELPVEEVHTNQPTKSTRDVHLVKRTKQNHPEKPQKSLNDWKCRKCSLLFPSVTQLLEHHLVHRKGGSATDDRPHHSNMPAHDRPRRFQQVQNASSTAGDGFTDKPYNAEQLPSAPWQRAPADKGFLQPLPSFVQEQTNSPYVPPLIPSALERSAPGIQSSSSVPVGNSVPKLSSNVFPRHQLRIPDRESLNQIQVREKQPETMHKCWGCKNWFRESENVVGVCNCHPGELGVIHDTTRISSNYSSGRYSLLTAAQMKPYYFKGGVVPSQPCFAWTCCRRPEKDAPPCRMGSRHSRLPWRRLREIRAP